MKKQNQPKAKPAPMDPVLIQAFARGREAGIKAGKAEGISDTLILFNEWIEEIDQHVKGIGPKTKLEIETYLGDRIKEAFEKTIEMTKEKTDAH